LVVLINESLLPRNGVASGISKFCEDLEDYVLDVPKAQMWTIHIISTLCVAKVLDLAWLASCGGLMAEGWKLEGFSGFSTRFAVQVLGAIAMKIDVATAMGLSEVLDLRTKAGNPAALDALLREAGLEEIGKDYAAAKSFVLAAKDEVEQFLALKDEQKVVDAFKEWGTPVPADTHVSPFVHQLLDLLCTKYRDDEVDATANLLVVLINESLLPRNGVASGISKFCEDLEDYVLDVPKAQMWTIHVISTLCVAKVLDLAWLASCGGLMAEGWKLEGFSGFSTRFAVQVLGAIAMKSDVATAMALSEVLDLCTKAGNPAALDALLREAGPEILANAFEEKNLMEDYNMLMAMQESLSSPLVWRLQLDNASTFDLESLAGGDSVVVTVEGAAAAMVQQESGNQETQQGMRRTATALSNGHFIPGSAAAAVETERLALVEQRLEAAKCLKHAVIAWRRSRAKSKSRASQGRDASASGSAIGHNDDDKFPATEEERTAELLAALPPWPSSTHGCAICGKYWPKDVKAFLNNAKQRFVAVAKQTFGPIAWAAAVAEMKQGVESAKRSNSNKHIFSVTGGRNQAQTAASSSRWSLSLDLEWKVANALNVPLSSGTGSKYGDVSGVPIKAWKELKSFSGSSVILLCQKIDAAESALSENREASVKGNRSSKWRTSRGDAGGRQQSVASSANLDMEMKSLLAEAKRMHKQSVTTTIKLHTNSPAHKGHRSRWCAYTEAEHDLCVAAARAQLFMHRLPPADVTRAMPKLGVAIEYQLVLAAKGRNYEALRRGNSNQGDRMVSALKGGANFLRDLHAQTAADLDDSVYLWNGGNRGDSNSGGNGAAAAAVEDESDNEEGDDDDGEVDDGDFTLARAAKKGGNGKSKSGAKSQPDGGEGDGEWTTVGSKKKKNPKKGQQKGGRSRGGLVRKPRR